MKHSILILTLVAAMTACSKKEAPPTPPTADEQRAEHLANAEKNRKLQDLLEQQRATALANVETNARGYFAANPRFDSSWKIVGHTDDYIGPACPQGSGWAWVSIMKVEGKNVEKNRIWCSTSSSSIGCYIDADFLKGPHAGQSTKCDANLPHPLKPLTK
jgi:hypothetical protein